MPVAAAPPFLYNIPQPGPPPTYTQHNQGRDPGGGGGGGPKNQAPRTLEEKLAHVHDWIKMSLQPFHKKFNGRVMVTKMLELGGEEWKDLPAFDCFVDDRTNKIFLCYNNALGYCSGKNCRFKHARKDQITDKFAKDICLVVEEGAKWLVLNETPAPGSNNDKSGGKQEGPLSGGGGGGGGSPSKKGKGDGKA